MSALSADLAQSTLLSNSSVRKGHSLAPVILRDQQPMRSRQHLVNSCRPSMTNSESSNTSDELKTPPSASAFLSSQSRKRKGGVVATPLSVKMRCVTARPLLKAMVDRCVAYNPASDLAKSKHTVSINYNHPYSPSSDWGNTRSSNPSPGEFRRAEKLSGLQKMSKSEKRARQERIFRVQELVREMKASANGEIYVPREIIIKDTSLEAISTPTQAFMTTVGKNSHKKKAPSRSKNGTPQTSPHFSARAQTQSPRTNDTPLSVDAEPPQTVPLVHGKTKPSRQKKSPVDALAHAKDRSKREAGVPERLRAGEGRRKSF
nr:hypothetical protein L203_05602 [Cryptococcus depauperatus CBS 7841]